LGWFVPHLPSAAVVGVARVSLLLPCACNAVYVVHVLPTCCAFCLSSAFSLLRCSGVSTSRGSNADHRRGRAEVRSSNTSEEKVTIF
jgi:hypothetical protein